MAAPVTAHETGGMSDPQTARVNILLVDDQPARLLT